jgi:hypothetical protein
MTNDRLGRLFSLSLPGSVLQDDSVAVGVLEGHTVAVPVGIERGYRVEPSSPHRADGGFIFSSVKEIEDQKIVLTRSPASRMTVSMRELKMIRCAWTPQHHAVESVVVLKTEEDLETESVAVKTDHRVEIISGPGYA